MTDSIYLDNNATTRLDPEVREAMAPFLDEAFGNPSSLHAHGQRARRGVDLAREQVAALINAEPEEIVFTSGGTEANNLALMGTCRGGHRIISQETEHPAVLLTLEHQRLQGAQVVLLPVTRDGVVLPEDLALHLDLETRLVSIMTANNDTGTLQPIPDLVEVAHRAGALFHTDAVQALSKIPVDVRASDVDLASFAAHKIYGPKGVGALYVKRGTRLAAITFGGSQESRRRAGTENTAGIVGFGKACELAKARLENDRLHIACLRHLLEAHVDGTLSDTQIWGPADGRLPGTILLTIRGIEGETLLMAMDMRGISISVGSACHSEFRRPSHVLSAMGVCPADARSAVRISIGRNNTEDDVQHTIQTLDEILHQLRNRQNS